MIKIKKVIKYKEYYPLILGLTLFLFLFFSCRTQKWKDKVCETCKSEVKTKVDTFYTKQVVKLDSNIIFVAGPIRYLPNPCEALCDSSGKLKKFDFVTNHNGIKQELKSEGNVLIQKCNIDSLLIVNKTITNDNYHLSKEKEEYIKKINELTKRQEFFIKVGKICFWSFIILIVLAIIYAIFRVRNKIKEVI